MPILTSCRREGSPMSLDVGCDDYQAGTVTDGFVGVQQQSGEGMIAGRASARVRSTFIQSPEDCWGAIQVRSGLQVTKPTAWPSCRPRLASEAARMTPMCFGWIQKSGPPEPKRSRSRKIHQYRKRAYVPDWRTTAHPAGRRWANGWVRSGQIARRTYSRTVSALMVGLQGGAARVDETHFTIVATGILSIKDINTQQYKLHLPSSDPKNVYLNNKREYETFEIVKNWLR